MTKRKKSLPTITGLNDCMLPPEEYQFWQIPEEEWREAYNYELLRELDRCDKGVDSPEHYIEKIDPDYPSWIKWSVSQEKKDWDHFTSIGPSKLKTPVGRKYEPPKQEIPTWPDWNCELPERKAFKELAEKPYQLSKHEGNAILNRLWSASIFPNVRIALFEIDISKDTEQCVSEFRVWLKDQKGKSKAGNPGQTRTRLRELAVYRLAKIHTLKNVADFVSYFERPFLSSPDEVECRKLIKKVNGAIAKRIREAIAEECFTSPTESIHVHYALKNAKRKFPVNYLNSITQTD